MDQRASLKHSRLRWILGAVALGVVIVAAIAWWTWDDPLRSEARRQWRDQAVAAVERQVDDGVWINRRLAELEAAAQPGHEQGHWVSDDLLVMRNGEWIVCRNVCAKEQNSGIRRDLFIGLGSDGKWYCSTFHFCVGMIVLHVERQPDTLEQFVECYWLVPFNGESDESLKATWDGGAYGEQKLQASSSVGSAR